MMILGRYISRTVFFAILLVLVVILSVDVIAEIIDEVGEMKANYGFSDVMLYVVTTMPRRIYENIPFSALIGCLIGLGVLASNSELVIMRASGVSLMRVVSFVLYPVMLFILLALAVGEFAVPYTDQLAEGRRAIQMGRQDNMNNTGLWNREGNEFINVSVVFPDGDLYGVFHYRFDDNNVLTETSFSEKAVYSNGVWQESRVQITRLGENSTTTHSVDSREWHTTMTPNLMRLVSMDASSLPMADLYQYGNYLNEQGQNSSRHWLAFWRKALQPLTILSLVLIAVSFVFGPLRESTTGLRVFAGVVTGIVFSTSQDMLGPASLVYGFAPFWAVLVPVIVSVLLGGLLLKRAA